MVKDCELRARNHERWTERFAAFRCCCLKGPSVSDVLLTSTCGLITLTWCFRCVKARPQGSANEEAALTCWEFFCSWLVSESALIELVLLIGAQRGFFNLLTLPGLPASLHCAAIVYNNSLFTHLLCLTRILQLIWKRVNTAGYFSTPPDADFHEEPHVLTCWLELILKVRHV